MAENIYSNKKEYSEHDYSDSYHQGKNNPSPHHDFSLPKVAELVDENNEATKPLKQKLFERLISASPGIADSTAEVTTVKIRMGTASDSAVVSEPQTFNNEESYTKYSWQRELAKVKELSREFLNCTEEEKPTNAQIDDLYDLLNSSVYEATVSINDLKLISNLEKLALDPDMIVNKTQRGKLLNIVHHYLSSLNHRIRYQDGLYDLRETLKKKIKSGKTGDIETIIGVLEQNDDNINDLSIDILNQVIPGLNSPLENIENQIILARYCNKIRFKLTEQKGLSGDIRDSNRYIGVIVNSLDIDSTITPEIKVELIKLLEEDIDIYTKHLDQISNSTLNHFQIKPLIVSVMKISEIEPLSQNYQEKSINLFIMCYNEIYSNNYLKIQDDRDYLLKFSSQFGLTKIHQDILNKAPQ